MITAYRVQCHGCNAGPWRCTGCDPFPTFLGQRAAYVSYWGDRPLTIEPDYEPAWRTPIGLSWDGMDSPGGRIIPSYSDPGLPRYIDNEAHAMISLSHLANIFYDSLDRLTSLGFEVVRVHVSNQHGQVSEYTGQVTYNWQRATWHLLGPASILTHHRSTTKEVVPYVPHP